MFAVPGCATSRVQSHVQPYLTQCWFIPALYEHVSYLGVHTLEQPLKVYGRLVLCDLPGVCDISVSAAHSCLYFFKHCCISQGAGTGWDGLGNNFCSIFCLCKSCFVTGHGGLGPGELHMTCAAALARLQCLKPSGPMSSKRVDRNAFHNAGSRPDWFRP